jgi:hypothetical protein
MPTPRRKPFALTGRASGPKSRALLDRRSNGQWKSGWRSSRSGSSTRMPTRASNPADGAGPVDWLESCLLPPPGQSSPGRRSSRTVGGHNHPISSVAAVAGGGAGADFRPANPRLRRVRFRHDRRRRPPDGGIAPPAHRHPRQQGVKASRATRRRRSRERVAPSRIPTGAIVVEVAAGVAARDREVHRARAGRPAQVTAAHQADGSRVTPNTPE